MIKIIFQEMYKFLEHFNNERGYLSQVVDSYKTNIELRKDLFITLQKIPNQQQLFSQEMKI